MSDSVTPAKRSENMRRVKSKNTKPEMLVRKLLYSLGYRYRLHARELPGKPDIVFRGRAKALFVHGCFWHQHSVCRRGRPPASRHEFWIPKLARNLERDQAQGEKLAALGWEVLVVWECELADRKALEARLEDFLGTPTSRKLV